MSKLKVLDGPGIKKADEGQCIASVAPEALPADDAVRMAGVFKALADPVRLRIFSDIASHDGGEACVCDIADVGVSQPTVSHHLKKLREAGLLTSERRRTWVYYKVIPGALEPLAAILAPHLADIPSRATGGHLWRAQGLPCVSPATTHEVIPVTDDPPPSGERPRIDASVPHSARIFTYWLGGKDHYPVDREAGERVREAFPGIVDLALAGRQFLGRTVRYLAGEAGVRQFLDVGTGLPTVDNTHEVAQRVAPDARIVYVDNDPLVLLHAQALLASAPAGRTDYVDADLRDPGAILEAASRTLDFSRPVALMLLGILAHIDDYDEARRIVRRLMDGLPPGSYLTVRDGTDTDEAYTAALRGYNASGAVPYHLRTPEQIAGYFEGLALVAPGVVPCPRWRPETADPWDKPEPALLGGMARKP